ncbi:hypothetical protein WMY93_014721 [Mugilogobius chulae]|uniref:PWWP domain-containing protein n=1 Tax=Mugilogobius chulae TaxID=88201 RepID=A0AAW0NVQ9_9GOBI
MSSKNSGEPFKAGDLVFAKMKGFPHWPARVCKSDSGYKKRVPVYYFGTHQIGSVPIENVVPYLGNKTKYGSGVRIKGFAEGMWEIQNTPGVGSRQQTPKSKMQTPSKSPVSKFLLQNLQLQNQPMSNRLQLKLRLLMTASPLQSLNPELLERR